MIDISTTHRVLCSLTSLLVLESEEDYIKYGITRKGLSDILIVGDKGVELKKRSISQSMKDKIAAQKLAEETARKEAEERQRKRDAEKKSYLYKAKKALSSLSGAFTRSAESDSMVLAEAASTQTEGMEEESFDGDSASSVGSAPDFGGAPRNGGGDHSANRGAGGASEVIADAVDAEHDAFSDSDDEAELSEAPVASPRRAPSIRRPTVRRAPPRTASDTSVTSGDVVRERRVMGAPPSPPESRPSTTRPSGRVTPAPKRTAPSWVGDANYTPFKKTLVKLEKAVRANPKDRRKRNAYCWALMKAQKYDVLLNEGLDWQNYDPSNPMVYEFIGIALMALGNESDALRAYASIAEVSPSASGLLNRGGYLLMKLGKYETAETLFRFAIERRPDHHNNYRGLALSLWYQERFKDAVDVLIEVLAKEHNSRYKSLNRVLKEELGYVLRGWYHKSPSDLKEAREIARKHGVNLQRTDDARITLHWETDANDVDLHVVDPANEECYYSHKTNASGVTLYADLTQGLGPEVISVPKGRIVDGAYHVGVKYFSAGPMGVSRGIVLIQQEDENGMPRVQIEAFTLLPAVEGQSQDMRHITVLEN
jgi:tetratricopeptide (TPR) repeat protein